MNSTLSKPIWIRLSGGVRVEVNGALRTELGTSRNRALLALLALRIRTMTTRETAIDLIWPDTDPNVGRNRLSTALVFLRKLLTLETDPGNSALLANQTHIWLNPELCEVDVLRVEETVEHAEQADNPMPLLEEAFALFQGGLAPELFDDWIVVHQIRFGELMDSVARQLIDEQLAADRIEAARRTLHRYRRLADSTEADGWQDHIAAFANRSPVELNLDISLGRNDSSQMDLGALAPDSPLYVERDSDDVFHSALRNGESIVLVKGPRQIGKTSLIARGVRACYENRLRSVFTDFQKFPSSLMSDEEAFFLAVAHSIARQLAFAYDFERNWRPAFGSGMNLEYFVRGAVDSNPTPLVWFVDEGDKLFGSPFASDFYGLIRSFHNSRAIEVSGPLSRLTITISYATEAYLFIRDLNQSPFNVGRRILLEDFTLDQVRSLNERLGSPLASPAEIAELVALVGGHPFLIRRSLNVIRQGMSLHQLKERSHSLDGPFEDHLTRILASMSSSPDSLACVQSILAGDRPPTSPALQRLIAAGVVVPAAGQKPQIRNALYRNFLLSALQVPGE